MLRILGSGLIQLYLVLFNFPVLNLAYNRPGSGCEGWPSANEWQSLRDSLTGELHGPFNEWNYIKDCYLGDDTHFEDNGNGICLHKHPCVSKNCELGGPANLPEYSVEAKSIEDVQAALTFANEHDIEVVVKSSGHSFLGTSTASGALLIWMRNFPHTNLIHDYTDSCGTTRSSVQVAGGQNIAEVMDVVQDQYHIVVGEAPAVTLGGGYLLGGGLSRTHRMYGYAIDNVLMMEVVLANGTVVEADACTHADLFWALRGGGGGNYGVMTRLEYKLHEVTPLVSFRYQFELGGRCRAVEREFAEEFMRWFLPRIPTLDRRWYGSWGPSGGTFFYIGDAAGARSSQFLQDFDAFHERIAYLDLDTGSKPSDRFREFDSWYDRSEGRESATTFDYELFSMVVPMEVLENRVDAFIDFALQEFDSGDFTFPFQYIYGGAITDTPPESTGMNPVMRQAGTEMRFLTLEAADRMREWLGDSPNAICFNHFSNAKETNTGEKIWGSHYPRLLELKELYDPDHRFNSFRGVGYMEDPGGCSQKKGKKFVNLFSAYFFWAVETGFRAFLDADKWLIPNWMRCLWEKIF